MTYREGNWFVTDLSRRGTFVGAQRLEPGRATLVQVGDRLRFGDQTFTLVDQADETDPLGPDGSYTLSVREVDLAAIDEAKVLRAALELPGSLGYADNEASTYATACEYLVTALSPVIATAYVTVGRGDGTVEVLGQAECPDVEGARKEILEPQISRRVAERLTTTPGSVLFLQRQSSEKTLEATVTPSTHVLGACLLEVDQQCGPTILYAVGNHSVARGEQLVAEYLRLVATLIRQHLLTLRRARLAKYFSPKVLKLFFDKGGSAELEGEPRVTRATSLFFDVRGSSLPLDASAEDLALVYHDLRSIIGLVTDAVFEHEGTVIDYAGDGVFAAWGVPLAQPDQARLAVRCAVAIADRLRGADFPGLGPSHSLFGIGIAMGEVLAGTIGSPAVLKYGILGPTVSAASRLVELTKPAQLGRKILITAEVHDAIRSEGLTTYRVGPVELAGLGPAVEIFELVDRPTGQEYAP